MPEGYMYILKCSDDTYYTGSTKDLNKRINEHKNGNGANYTSKRLPVKLVYFEKFERIDLAFEREHQVKRWSHGKKLALIDKQEALLNKLSECQNKSHFENHGK